MEQEPLTPKEQIEVERKKLTGILKKSISEFEESTGLSVDELRVIRSAGFPQGFSKFIGVDVIIKL